MREIEDLERTKRVLLSLSKTPPSDPHKMANARKLYLEQAARFRSARSAAHTVRLQSPWRVLRPVFAILGVVILASLGLFTMVAYAADSARPGDMLYPLDRGIEELRLVLAVDSNREAELRLVFADERLLEAEELASEGDEENMTAALEAYGQMISAAAQVIVNEGSADREALATLLDLALSRHELQLQTIRSRVSGQAQKGLDRAIEAARKVRQIVPPVALPNEDRPSEKKPSARPENTPIPPVTPGPPTGIPAEPPTSIPVWPPTHIPAGLPTDIPAEPPVIIPHGPPDEIPFGPPIDPGSPDFIPGLPNSNLALPG